MTRRVLLLDIGAGDLPAATPTPQVASNWFPTPYVAPPPLPPANFALASIVGGVRASWDAVAGINVSYELERAPDSADAPGASQSVYSGTAQVYNSNESAKTWWRVRTSVRGVPSSWTDWASATPIASATAGDVAAAQAAASDAQNTADQAIANTPAVINPQLKVDTTGWTFDTAAGFYREQGVNSPDSACNTYLVRGGQAGGAPTVARNLGYVPVQPGQTVTAVCCLKSLSANAGASSGVRISWRDVDHAELSVTRASVTCGPGGTYLQCVSKAVGQAPAGAQFAHAEIEYISHSSGFFTATSCGLSVQPAGLGEVPDGGGRHAVNQVDSNGLAIVDFGQGGHVNKNLDNIGDGALFLRATAPIGTGSSWDIDNALFQGPAPDGSPLGWTAQEVGANIYYQSAGPTPAYGSKYAVLFSGSTASGRAESRKTFNVKPGDRISVSALIYAASSQFSAASVAFYDAAGAYIGGISAFSSAPSWVGAIASGVVPSNAVTAKVVIQCTIAYSYALFNAVVVTVNDVRVAGSGARLGDLRNQVMTGVGNYGAGWSGGSITYSATSTSATISAAAATLQVDITPIAYNASSVTVSGSPGTSTTYYLYYDDDNYSGGSRTLNATTSQITALSARGRLLVGTCTVVFPTSGTGSGGTTGPCPDEDAWVLRADPDGVWTDTPVQAKTIVAGHYLRLTDGRCGEVTYSNREAAPRVRVFDENGATLTCSTSAPLELAGTSGKCILAPESVGEQIKACAEGIVFGSLVWKVEDAGHGYVQHITCQDACFWTGDNPDYLFGHHNLKALP